MCPGLRPSSAEHHSFTQHQLGDLPHSFTHPPTMSGVLCVWAADLPESSEQWYENEYIPEMLSRHSDRVLLAETIATPLDKQFEGIGTRDAAFKSLVVYEVAEVQKIIDATYDESNHPVMDGPLRGTRFDVRPYELLKSWQSDEEWNGGR
jgi:hypothetical protein